MENRRISGPCSRFSIVRGTQRRHNPPMARARPSARDLFPSLGQECSSSSPPASSLPIVTDRTEAPARHVLPKNLDAAIRQLDDQELNRLVTAALEERARRKPPPVPNETQPRKRDAEAVAMSLPQGKLNAIRAAFKAGVIAREFGISQQDVRKALASDARKQ